MAEGFWYLATPYARYPGGRAAAFEDAASRTAFLMRAGIEVYSPIVHNHTLDLILRIPPEQAHDYWLARDRPMMEAAVGLIVCKLEGWNESRGIAVENRIFQAAGKPVVWMEPNQVPALPEME